MKTVAYKRKAIKRIKKSERADDIRASVEALANGERVDLEAVGNGQRIRVGNVRVLIKMDGDHIEVLDIQPRGQAYKKHRKI